MKSERSNEWLLLIRLTLFYTFFLLISSISTTRYTHVYLFAFAIALFPAVMVLLSRDRGLLRFVRGGITALYWPAFYWVFVDYHDKPWFVASDPLRCDGPCFGWYTFEFEPPYREFAILSMVSLGIGIVLALGLQFLRRSLR